MLELLPAAAPGASAVLGNAEVIPLPDASADVVTAAQAFHWFDHEVALPEIARVLRPGGRLALVWNTRDDRESWVAELSRVIGSETIERGDVEEPIAESGLFGPVEKATFASVAATRPRAASRSRPLAELLRVAASGGARARARRGRPAVRRACGRRRDRAPVRHRVLPDGAGRLREGGTVLDRFPSLLLRIEGVSCWPQR